MQERQSFYPPSPANVPEELTEVSPDYQLRVVLLLACVVFFFSIYIGLLVLALVLIYWGIMLEVR